MMRSMYSGVSGLKSHQMKMDVIANNIANVNTVGYKSSRVVFSEMFSQNIGGATAANATTGKGGQNPDQIGLGTTVGAISKNMNQGATQITSAPLDIAIQDNGFFIVSDASGTYYTRAGAMTLDEEGNLVTESGMKVMGWNAIPDPNNPGEYIVEKSAVEPIVIGPDKQYVPPQKTTSINMSKNLNADEPAKVGSMSFYDSLGNSYTVDVQYTYNASGNGGTGSWDYQIGNFAYPNGDRNEKIVITQTDNGNGDIGIVFDHKYDENNTADAALPMFYTPADAGYVSHELVFDANGLLISGDTMALTVTDNPGVLVADATFGKGDIITVHFEDLTQFGEEVSTATSDAEDGCGPGELTGISVGSDGTIMGSYSNGQLRPLGQVAEAYFENPEGLAAVGGSLFAETANSGSFDGMGSVGNMQAGALEMSNVDLATEFTEMIVTQRGYQACSRTITTSDELLQELVNLKR